MRFTKAANHVVFQVESVSWWLWRILNILAALTCLKTTVRYLDASGPRAPFVDMAKWIKRASYALTMD